MSKAKDFAKRCHKLGTLALLMQDTLDDIKPILGDYDNGFSKTCEDMSSMCENIVTAMFGVDEVYRSTYIQELTNKVDTCIRKNYVFIPGEKDD